MRLRRYTAREHPIPLAIVLATAPFVLLPATPALAAKQVVDFFGGSGALGGQFSDPQGIAVNHTGAGGVPVGTIYVSDGGADVPGARGNRIQRFQRDDNGTPADATDDTYSFVSAWGAGVDGAGADYEICTVAADCDQGEPIGGNGAPGGNGALNGPAGVAVDQDTGEVYVVDGGRKASSSLDENNARINVYSATGAFLRSFGWDVVESGPGDNGTGYEVCKAGADVCKAGLAGSGAGQLGVTPDGEFAPKGIAVSQPDGNPATGTVFLADLVNQRVNTYALDGSAPGAIGSAVIFAALQPKDLAVDSRGVLYASNSKNEGQIERYDTLNANGAGAGFLAPIASPPLIVAPTEGLAVDPDTDGAGPDGDVLHALRRSVGSGSIQQLGPLNPPGLTAPPAAVDDTHGMAYPYQVARALAIELPTDRLYIAAFDSGLGYGVFVLDTEGPSPTATLDSIAEVTARSAVAHATIDPNGPPNTSYRFEYSTDQIDWTPTGEVLLGHQEDPQAVQGTIGLGAGLHPKTHYHVRLVAGRRFSAPVITASLDFTTGSAPPLAETTGSPIHTATTAQIEGRVLPSNDATEYRFEYGTQGPCSSNPCTSTPLKAAGSGDEFVLVAEPIEGMDPSTTYHYRLIADNGHPSGPAIGKDMTVATHASDASLSRGPFPGPPGSDRTYEQVSLPDTGGNPVPFAFAVSDDGNRAFYRVAGGTPLSVAGSLLTPLYAERTETAPHQGGWNSINIFPPRQELVGSGWLEPAGRRNLADQVTQNFNTTTGLVAIWRLRPGQVPGRIFEPPFADFQGPVVVSEDASRVLTFLRGAHDPAHPPPNDEPNLYDVSSGAPSLVGLLPDGSVPGCGAFMVSSSVAGASNVRRAPHFVSADGSLAFFQSCGGLYLRDLFAEETKLVATESFFVKSTPEAVLFTTSKSLDSDDSDDSGGGDLYRYDLGDETRECVTCLVPGLAADVSPNDVVVSEDGSRAYFVSSSALLPGASASGIYRVETASGDLAYVAPAAGANAVSDNPNVGNALTPDGSVFVFASGNADLNPLGGQQNGGTLQYYRYDDRDRSLTCLSCPQDGSVPQTSVIPAMLGTDSENEGAGANKTALSSDGYTFAFATSNPLRSADQNTARPGQGAGVGTDIYEWRDGRLLLVTDGITEWRDEGPKLSAITPSGDDIFFTAAAQYTPDALDGYRRLYDARIGGGFEFPSRPKPCPLEVCQGIPKGAPEEGAPGTSSFAGAGNVASPSRPRKCPKGRHRARRGGKTRCVKRNKGQRSRNRQRAKHHRRNAR